MINFSIIGTNFISDLFVEAGKQHKDFNVSAVYSRNQETGNAFSKKHNIKNIYTNMEKMVADKKFDAVYIASPNCFHKEQAEFFLKNKIPVLLEKPLASNMAETTALVELSKKHNTLLMEGLRTIFEPRLKAVKDNLYKVGKIRRIIAGFSQYSSRYDKFKNGIIENAFNPVFSNGAAMDIGIYVVEPVVQCFGKPKSMISSGILLENSIDGQGSIILTYDDMEAILTFSKIADGKVPSEIQGENGTMLFYRQPQENGENISILYRDGTTEKIKYANDDKHPMYYEIEEFISLLKSGSIESDVQTHEGMINSMEIIDKYRKNIGLHYPCDV